MIIAWWLKHLGFPAAVGPPFSYNTVGSGFPKTAGSTIIADLIDSSNAATGVSLSVGQPINTTTGSTGWASTGVDVFPQGTLQGIMRGAGGATCSVVYEGLTAGDNYSLKLIANDGSSGSTLFTVGGVELIYTSSGDANNPNPPVVFTGTVPPGGVIEAFFEPTGGAFYGHLNGAYLETSAAGPILELTPPASIASSAATSLTITGVDPAVTAISLTLSDGTTTVTQTIDSQSHDGTETLTVNFTPVQGNIKFQSGLTLEATLSDESTVSGTTELVTISGNAAVDVVSPVTTENSVYHEATSPNADTPETGDQIEHTDSGNTTVAADGTITQTEVRSFEARFWSVTDNTWGSFETISPFDVDAVVGGLTRRNITRRALTRRAMTSRGMTS